MTQPQLHQAESGDFSLLVCGKFFLFSKILSFCSNKFFPLLEKSDNLAGRGSLCAHPYTRGRDFGSPVLK